VRVERVYEVSSSTRRLSGCPGGKGMSMTVQAGAIKHVAFVSRLHAYQLFFFPSIKILPRRADAEHLPCTRISKSRISQTLSSGIVWRPGEFRMQRVEARTAGSTSLTSTHLFPKFWLWSGLLAWAGAGMHHPRSGGVDAASAQAPVTTALVPFSNANPYADAFKLAERSFLVGGHTIKVSCIRLSPLTPLTRHQPQLLPFQP